MNPGAVAPALIALALIVFAPPARGELIEVMSFNIRYGTAADGDNAWSLRREMVTSLMSFMAQIRLGANMIPAPRDKKGEKPTNRQRCAEEPAAR